MRVALALLAALTAAGPPDGPRGLHAPRRLTAGDSNQLNGALAPNGWELYFVTDRQATAEVMRVDLRRGAPSLVFDNEADATQPRISPSGGRLLYLSYRRDSTGDVCIADVVGGGRRCLTGPESTEVQAFWYPDGRSVGVVSRAGLHQDFRLLRVPADGDAEDAAVVLAANVASPAISPDARWLAYVPIERSSDEVGVNFAMRSALGLAVRRLEPPGAEPLRVRPPLPGKSGFPAFSQDGRWLYFSQYLNDTNFDGTIDGHDHAVVFRVPFDAGSATPVPADTMPQQLTAASWNCQYPAPAADRLILTCSHGGSLDVYSLPLAGAVPEAWDADRVAGEVAASRDPWERLLLLGHQLARAADPATRLAAARRMSGLHAGLHEYRSAEFYRGLAAELADRTLRHGCATVDGEPREQVGRADRADRVDGRAECPLDSSVLADRSLSRGCPTVAGEPREARAAPGGRGGARAAAGGGSVVMGGGRPVEREGGAAAAGSPPDRVDGRAECPLDSSVLLAAEQAVAWAGVMEQLIGHRRDEQLLTDGMRSDVFLRGQEARLGRLRKLVAAAPQAAAFAAVVTSEILDVVGDKGRAAEALAAVDPEAVRDPEVLPLLGERAVALLGRQLEDRREPMLELLLALSGHPVLGLDERMRQASRFVHEVGRGLPRAARAAAVAAWSERVEPESEAGTLLALEALLLRLVPENQEEIRKAVFDLYKANRQHDRRRALVLSTARRAADHDNAYLLYEFANSWVSGVRRAHPERKHAERLYVQVVLERAYEELAAGEVSDARGHFFGVTRIAEGSLEAHVGFVDARLREGHDDVQEMYLKRFAKSPDDPTWAFVQAYLDARRLDVGERPPGSLLPVLDAALGRLGLALDAYPQSSEVQHLRGHLLHRRFLAAGDPEDAFAAHAAYLLALDLARDNPRYRASTLLGLGVLQASVGNHRIATRHFAARAALPFAEPAAELSFHVHRARSLFHSGADAAAAEAADAALALIAREPALARFRPLGLDRAGLYRYAAGDAGDAVQRYGELLPLLVRDDTRPSHRLRLRVVRGAAAVAAGDVEAGLRDLEAAEGMLDAGVSLTRRDLAAHQRAFAEHLYTRRDYRILLAGLRGHALAALGRLPEATAALTRRLELTQDRAGEREVDDDLLDLAGDRLHLADLALRAGDLEAARRHLEAGLAHSGAFQEATGSPSVDLHRQLLLRYAALHVDHGVPRAALARDVAAEVRTTHEWLVAHPSPRTETDRFLLGVYRTVFELGSGAE